MMADITVEPVTTTLIPGDISMRPQVRATAGSNPLSIPAAGQILFQMLRVWIVGLVVFGYVLGLTYGMLVWLMNGRQWFYTQVMYAIGVPVIGGLFVVYLPWLRYRPVHQALRVWAGGEPIDRARCTMVYERALRMPWWVASGAVMATLIGYCLGSGVVHVIADKPMVEFLKTLPAIPFVGGLLGAFCYFGTTRALHPVVTWCSVQLRHVRPVHPVPLGVKFFTTTCVLAVAALSLLQPTAYTLGQIITEQHLMKYSQLRLLVTAGRVGTLTEDWVTVLTQEGVGAHGYVFAIDPQGNILTPHPRGYTHIAQERFFELNRYLNRANSASGAWVDRVGHHRVVAFARTADPNKMLVSVSFPIDHTIPLRHFARLSWVVVFEVIFLVILFGRYYTRGITTPLAELRQAAQRIAEYGDLSQFVPVSTNDELGELARSFNRMVEELQASKAELEEYTRRLERSTQDLSAVNQEMEDLLRVVSHDLRAPLINIQGFSKRLEPVMRETVAILERVGAAPHEAGLQQQLAGYREQVHGRFTESLRFISKSVEKMDTLLSSLLAVSRVGRKADPVQINDLNEILDDVLATFDHQLKESAIQILRHPLPREVACRRNEINQVLSNIISNAINYMGATDRRFIEVGGAEHADYVECFIRDTGVGIRPEDHERVFQMFTRLQAVDVPGEGVGLAYVKKILRSHGGRIWVESKAGQGSLFVFTLPKSRQT